MSFLWHTVPTPGKHYKFEDRNLPENAGWTRRATSDLNEVLPEQRGCETFDAKFLTVPQQFRNIAAQHPDAASQCYQEERDGPFKSMSWSEHLHQAEWFAKALIALGVNSRDCITIKGFNHYAWAQSFLGAMFANVVPAGIYPTNGPDATWYIMDHTACKITVVDTLAHAEAMLALKPRLPELKHIVTYMENPTEELRKQGVLGWKEFLALGMATPIEKVHAREAEIKPTITAALVYTSGTTGNPKGVMLTHDNLMFKAQTATVNLDFTVKDRLVSFLPLSHIAACMLDLLVPLVSGYSLWYAQPDAMKGTLAKTLALARPTLLLAVPRVYEKIQEGLSAASRNGPAIMRFITSYTKPATKEGAEKLLFTKDGSMGLFPKIVDSTINKTIKKKLGLDECRIFASGAAPLAKSTQEYFLQLGMPISEILGMTESSAMIAMSQPIYGGIKFGACGRPFNGTECTLLDVDAEGCGELLYRGRTVFAGYYKDPAATAATITEDGYCRTGDICRIDEDGFVFVTGRSKELIITAGGENVAPVPIEDAIKSEVGRLVSFAMVIGDRKKFLTALITLNHANLEKDDTLSNDAIAFLQEKGIEGVTTVAQAKASKEVHTLIENGIKAANKKAVSRAQCVQKFTILDSDFSEATGELTATLKLKRAPTTKKFAAEIDSMYPEDQE